MTDQQHPITPPPELVQQWWTEFERTEPDTDSLVFIATQAARWGADQELEACLNEIYKGVGLRLIPYGSHRELLCSDLRAARRPEPPNLKKQALSALYAIATGADDTREFHQDIETIKTALEQLDD